jgi:hypothetical protein
VGETHLLANVEHRRLVPLPFADHNRAVDRHGVELAAHRFHRRTIRLMRIPLSHRLRAGDGRLLDDAKELEGEVSVHQSTSEVVSCEL